jgi:hypothetical protein
LVATTCLLPKPRKCERTSRAVETGSGVGVIPP